MFSPQLTNVQCKPKNEAPCEIHRGCATSDHQFAYFMPGNSTSVYSYEWSTELWRQLPSCPYRDSALVIIDCELTTVGGMRMGERKYDENTNKLMTLRQGIWVEEYPPMKTAQSQPAAVCTSDGDYIIVIGRPSFTALIGRCAAGGTVTVELFQVKTRQWYEITDQTQPLNCPSATICGNQLHVIGSDYNVVGYSYSLQALPSSEEPITPQSLPDLMSWTFLPRLPVIDPTIATLSGELIIIGGEQHGSLVNSIYQLVKGQWVKIRSMTSGRKKCLSVSPSPDRVMIVGGYKDGRHKPSICYCVEEFVYDDIYAV